MSILYSSISIKEINLRNRIVVSPMCQYSAVDGFAADWHLVHLGSRAVGGAGLLIQEATAVSPEGRISPADLGIYLDDHVEKLKQITSFIHAQGAVAGIQLAHAGRKASCAVSWLGGGKLTPTQGGWKTEGPSAIPFNPEEDAPEELTVEGIHKVISDFKRAARRAFLAGYKVLEIHAAHGYLIHQFLSPLSNIRNDNYGGSFENRIRLLLEVVSAVKSEWPENLPLFVRISATDWAEGGWDLPEAIQLSSLLKTNGVDVIDCSTGGMVPYARIPVAPGFQVPFAAAIRKEAGILTSAVGLITTPDQAEKILREGQADLIMFGRESLRNPYLGLQFASALEEDVEWPKQYARAK